MAKINNTSDDIIKATLGIDTKDHEYEIKEESDDKEVPNNNIELNEEREFNNNIDVKENKTKYSTYLLLWCIECFAILFFVVLFIIWLFGYSVSIIIKIINIDIGFIIIFGAIVGRYSKKYFEKINKKNEEKKVEEKEITRADKALFVIMLIYTICLVVSYIGTLLEDDSTILAVLGLIFFFSHVYLSVPIALTNIVNIIILRRKETMGLNILSLIILIIGNHIIWDSLSNMSCGLG